MKAKIEHIKNAYNRFGIVVGKRYIYSDGKVREIHDKQS